MIMVIVKDVILVAEIVQAQAKHNVQNVQMMHLIVSLIKVNAMLNVKMKMEIL